MRGKKKLIQRYHQPFFLIDHYKGTTNSENNDSHYLQAVAPTTEMFEDGNLIIF